MILNLMLGEKRGGLEQAALDYAEALRHAGIDALSVITPGAWIEAPLVAAGVRHESLNNARRWDPFAPRRLRALAQQAQARAVICHGNRALKLALRALRGQVPIIAVAHNYHTRRFARADACFAITQHLAEHLRRGGAAEVHAMPNMVRIAPLHARPPFRQPPVIGSMGRFVAKKGFEVYIDALAILRDRGVAFRAILGGDGDEAEALHRRIGRHGLGPHLTLTGWVQDKAAFYASIDAFVLPSHHEPFGIVLIEAMAQALPTVTTDSEGPREIVHPDHDALLVPRRDPEALADALARLLADPAQAAAMGRAGRSTVERDYSMEAMAVRLSTALQRMNITV